MIGAPSINTRHAPLVGRALQSDGRHGVLTRKLALKSDVSDVSDNASPGRSIPDAF